MNNQSTKTHPQPQNLENLSQLQPLKLEQLDGIVAAVCGCKGTFDRKKPHVNVGS